MNSITCWKVERLVQRMLNGISPGMNVIRSAAALEYQLPGFDPSVAENCIAAA